jgi:anti-sigma-K factor RskA
VNWRRRAELQERLAAEYALGTLRGRARARFERWLREDSALARAVAEWQERLAPLAAGVRPVAPPARLWRTLAERIGPSAGGSLWASLGLWRGLAFAASGMAAVLLAAVVFFSPAPPTGLAGSYLAVLSDPKTQKPLLLVSAERHARELQVRTLDASMRVSGKDLELWALPAGKPPQSLGVPARAERAVLTLAQAADRALADVPALAVSLEPEGGSRTGAPTGPVLAVGPCIRVW